MPRYSSSKLRILLLVVMLAGATLVITPSVFGQAPTPGGGEGASNQAQGLFQLIWGHKDPVFFTIAALSVAGLTLIFQGFYQNRAGMLMPEATTARIRDMIANRQFRELIEFTETDPSFVSRAINPALKRAPSFNSMKEAMETALAEQTAEQFRKIEYLNIIGNLGPLLGLLGTVLGMIEAFSEMQAKGGSANPADLAGGISTALTHTFLGLFLAVPCLAAFGVLRTLVDRLTIRGSLISEELLLMVKPADRGPAVPSNTLRPGAIPQPAAMPMTPSGSAIPNVPRKTAPMS